MDILDDIKNIVGDKNFLSPDQHDALPYFSDSYGRATPQHTLPQAVVLPRDVASLQTLTRFAHEKNIALIPMGGNTGRSLGTLNIKQPDTTATARPTIIVSLQHFNKILAINEKNNSLWVEAGVTLGNIQRAAQKINRFFPVNLGSAESCQVGGVLSTNAGGYNVFRYGMTRHWVLGLSVMLPNGDMITSNHGLRKDNSGYDLKQIFIGAEGTLGFIVNAHLALLPQPTQKLVGLCHAASLDGVIALYQQFQNMFGPLLAGFELIPDRGRILLHNQNKPYPGFLSNAASVKDFYALFEIDDFSDAGSDVQYHEYINQLQAIKNIMVIAKNDREQKELWAFRENIVWALKSHEPVARHDIAIPLDQWQFASDKIIQAVEKNIPEVIPFIFGHVGDGNLHYHFLRPDNMSVEQWVKKIPLIHQIVYDIVDAAGGSFSAEHGVGREKIAAWQQYKNNPTKTISQQIKNMLDPNNIMNPGVIFG